MENTIENAKAFLTKYRDERTHPVSVDYFAEMMTDYAASVSPEVVVPSEKRMNDLAQAFDELPKTKESKDTWECAAFKKGSRMTLSELRRLNPTMTFTENH